MFGLSNSTTCRLTSSDYLYFSYIQSRPFYASLLFFPDLSSEDFKVHCRSLKFVYFYSCAPPYLIIPVLIPKMVKFVQSFLKTLKLSLYTLCMNIWRNVYPLRSQVSLRNTFTHPPEPQALLSFRNQETF